MIKIASESYKGIKLLWQVRIVQLAINAMSTLLRCRVGKLNLYNA